MRKLLISLILSFILISYPINATFNEELPFCCKKSVSDEKFDYVVITTDSLKNSLEKFIVWKEDLGYSVKVVTTTWIYDHYWGNEEADKIRNFLIDKYKDWEIKYVLLVGSIYSIPMKRLYANPNHERYDLSDYYYADLTDNWDSDGDGYPGEYGDDDLTLQPDVYVGRLPFDNSADIKNYIEKLIKYEMDNGEWKKQALLLGPLTDPEHHCPLGGDYWVEPLKNNILQPAGFKCTVMYEKEGLVICPRPCDYPLNEQNVISEWSKGYGLVEWFSHGSEKAAWRVVWYNLDHPDWIPFIQSSDNKLLNDDQPSIVWSHGCLTAKPECLDNLCYSLLKHGAIIVCGATRPWGEYGEHGREFNREIIRGKSVGEAFWNAKVYSLTHNRRNTAIGRYGIVYGMNLHGDPSVYLYLSNRPPLQPSDPYPSNGSANIQTPLKLDWSDCVDLDGDVVLYDVYLGKQKNLTENDRIATNITDSEFVINNLDSNTKYYWKVVAKDEHGLKRTGPIWNFYTVDTEPPSVNITLPKKGYLHMFGVARWKIPIGTIIIGGIKIKVSATDNLAIDRVEFYIDDTLKEVKTEPPYFYPWNEKVLGRHTIKVLVYDKSNNVGVDELNVFAIIY